MLIRRQMFELHALVNDKINLDDRKCLFNSYILYLHFVNLESQRHVNFEVLSWTFVFRNEKTHKVVVVLIGGQVLESSNWFTSSRNKGNMRSGPQMGHHQPFLALVLTCLKDQEDQRESLLMSLQNQLSQCLQLAKEVLPSTLYLFSCGTILY